MTQAARNSIIPRWISLKNAMAYSGIGRDRLKELAQSGHVRGFKDPDNQRGDWVFDRISIDQYRLSQSPEQAKDLANAVIRSLN